MSASKRILCQFAFVAYVVIVSAGWRSVGIYRHGWEGCDHEGFTVGTTPRLINRRGN